MDATIITFFIQGGFAVFCYLLWKDNKDLRGEVRALEEKLGEAQRQFFNFVVRAASGPCPRFHDNQKGIQSLGGETLEDKDGFHG